MKAEDVASYLQNNPQFFETHADMLAEISIPHPHGGRTISLPERQMLTLRTNNKELEKKLATVLASSDNVEQELEKILVRVMDYLRQDVGEVFLRQEDGREAIGDVWWEWVSFRMHHVVETCLCVAGRLFRWWSCWS